MEVGIDALPLMGRGGVSRHLTELLSALVAHDAGHRYHLFARVFRPAQRRRYREAARAFAGPRLVWHRVFLPDRLLELAWTRRDVVLPGTARCLRGLDVFFATTGLAPAGVPCPIVGVVHDLVPLRFPQWFGAEVRTVRARLERLVARARLLLAVSEATRRELTELLGVPVERIRVVHHGIHPRFTAPAPERVAALLRARGIESPYFLHVGGLGPVKNIGTLLEAVRIARERISTPHALVLAGDPRWAGGLPADIERLGLGGAVRLLGFMDDETLPCLYAGATAVVLPSWWEGFGFPALEAMACGAPVLAARVGALPEVLGDAALFFAPDRPRELAEHLMRLGADAGLRRELAARGRARAPRFTWERAAAETLAVLEEAAAQPVDAAASTRAR